MLKYYSLVMYMYCTWYSLLAKRSHRAPTLMSILGYCIPRSSLKQHIILVTCVALIPTTFTLTQSKEDIYIVLLHISLPVQ